MTLLVSSTLLVKIGIIVILIALTLKLIEMVNLSVWCLGSRPNAFVAEFYRSTEGSLASPSVSVLLSNLITKHSFPAFPGNSLATRWLQPLFRQPTSRTVIGYFFRYPLLMISTALITFLITSPVYTFYFSTGIKRMLFFYLLAGIGIKALLLLSYRFALGPLDNIMSELSVPKLVSDITFLLTRRSLNQRFILIYTTTFTTFTIAFAALYTLLSSYVFPGSHIANVATDEPLFVQMLYFSATTFCTVGYGDLTPKGSIAQLVSVLQMFVGFTLLVILLTAMSITSSLDN